MDYKRSPLRRWLIFIICCGVAFLDLGLVLSFGTVFLQLLDRFGENRATTATVQSILVGTTTCCSVIAGVLNRKIGVGRVALLGSAMISGGFIFSFFAKSVILLDVFVGVFAGTGASFLYVSSAVVARGCFHGTGGDIAVGVQSVSLGLGAVAYPYIFRELEKHFIVTEAFLLLGGFLLNNFAASILFLADEKEMSKISKKQTGPVSVIKRETEDQNEDGIIKGKRIRLKVQLILTEFWKSFRAIMNIRYILVVLGTGLAISSSIGYFIVFKDIYASKGYTENDSVTFYTIFYALSAASRVIPVATSKLRPTSDLMAMLAFFALCGCAGQLCLLFTSQLTLVIVANVLTGITLGGVMSGSSMAVAKLSTTESFSVAFGMLLTSNGILSAASGVLAGYVRDNSKSYEYAIIGMATLDGVGACLYMALKLSKLCRTAKKMYVSSNSKDNLSPSETTSVASVSYSVDLQDGDLGKVNSAYT